MCALKQIKYGIGSELSLKNARAYQVPPISLTPLIFNRTVKFCSFTMCNFLFFNLHFSAVILNNETL